MQRGQEQDGEMGDTQRVRDLEEAGEKKAWIVIGANNIITLYLNFISWMTVFKYLCLRC